MKTCCKKRKAQEALDAAPESDDSKPLAKASATAKTRDEVLPAVGRLASDLRERLGDTEPESARLAARSERRAERLEIMWLHVQPMGAEQGRLKESVLPCPGVESIQIFPRADAR